MTFPAHRRAPGAGPGNGGEGIDPRTPFGGLYLAMDTSGRNGSVALGKRMGPWAEGGGVGQGAGEVEVLARTALAAEEEHAALLAPRIRDLLVEVGAEAGELEGIVVGAGPGSFTGVRVGAATAKGLARALEIPLWAYSSLAAAVVVGETPRADPGAGPSAVSSLHPRCVLFDARGDRVYAAAYRVAHGTLETLVEPTAATLSEVLEELIPPGAILMGDGALRHGDLLGEAGHPVLQPPAGVPSADGLLRLLALDPEAGPLTDPGRWEPEYLRASGAERTWKTRKGM